MFNLVFEDLGVKYEDIEHFKHLKSELMALYDIKNYMKGSKYLGLIID